MKKWTQKSSFWVNFWRKINCWKKWKFRVRMSPGVKITTIFVISDLENPPGPVLDNILKNSIFYYLYLHSPASVTHAQWEKRECDTGIKRFKQRFAQAKHAEDCLATYAKNSQQPINEQWWQQQPITEQQWRPPPAKPRFLVGCIIRV